MTSLKPTINPYQIRVPTAPELEKKKLAYLVAKRSIVGQLEKLREKLISDEPLSGALRRQFIDDIADLKAKVDKLDIVSYAYWEALDISKNPDKYKL